MEHFLGELDGAFHLGAAAGQHDAGGDHFLEAAAPQLLAHQAEQLLVARLDDLGERLSREAPCRALADRGHLDALVGIGELRERAGVTDLDVLGVLRRRAHRHRDVVGHLVTGDRDHRGVADRAVGEHRQIRGAAADVDQAHAELLLVLGEHGEAGGELLEHDVIDGEPAALDALLDVLCRRVCPGDDVHLGLEPHPGHADRVTDAFLAVDDELLRQHVQDLLIRRDRHRLGGIDHVVDIPVAHLLVAHTHDAVGVEAAHVAAGDAGEHRVDLAARHELCFLHRALDRLHRGFDVHDDALFQSPRGLGAEAEQLDRAIEPHLSHQRHDLGGADVEPDDEVAFCALKHRDRRPSPFQGRRCRASRWRTRSCTAYPRRQCPRHAA